ncbi:hypothetical protein MHBO_000232 [Bonamia ostreae]|uniref:Uncharacterized protein n=1 Tax=Bonamia ostreae TaxID=126728 RepID=A0ABV2AG65_9EUKA
MSAQTANIQKSRQTTVFPGTKLSYGIKSFFPAKKNQLYENESEELKIFNFTERGQNLKEGNSDIGRRTNNCDRGFKGPKDGNSDQNLQINLCKNSFEHGGNAANLVGKNMLFLKENDNEKSNLDKTVNCFIETFGHSPLFPGAEEDGRTSQNRFFEERSIDKLRETAIRLRRAGAEALSLLQSVISSVPDSLFEKPAAINALKSRRCSSSSPQKSLKSVSKRNLVRSNLKFVRFLPRAGQSTPGKTALRLWKDKDGIAFYDCSCEGRIPSFLLTKQSKT